MTNEQIQRELDTLETANSAYYQGNPTLSDTEFDARKRRLENEIGRVIHFSDLPASENRKVQHKNPLEGLNKEYDLSLLDSRFHHDNCVVSPKWDGASVTLYIEKGKLKQAVSRGKGGIGDDITQAVRASCKNIPMSFPSHVTQIRCEAVMRNVEFKKHSSKYANPRNLAAGVLRTLDWSKANKFNLLLIPVYVWSKEWLTVYESLTYLSELFFKDYPEFKSAHVLRKHKTQILEQVEHYITQKEVCGVNTDGVVVMLDELSEHDFGTGENPSWAVAYKVNTQFAYTELNDVYWSVGRTGKLVPNAVLKPVDIDGSTVSYATLHNPEYIKMLNLHLGDRVEVSKRGDIIPAIERVVVKNGGSPIIFPSRCPACGSLTNYTEAEVYCSAPFHLCKEQLIAAFEFFASRQNMNIVGFGSEAAHHVVMNLDLTHFYELYELNAGHFPRNGTKIVKEIQKSRDRDLATVLRSVSIPLLGKSTAQAIAEKYRSMDEVLFAHSFSDIEGIGEHTSTQIINTLSSGYFADEFKGLSEFLTLEMPKTELEGSIFEGQTWCVTGQFMRFTPREVAMEYVKKLGGRVTGSISGKTTHVLVGKGGGKNKAAAIIKNGCKSITEDEFVKMLGEHFA